MTAESRPISRRTLIKAAFGAVVSPLILSGCGKDAKSDAPRIPQDLSSTVEAFGAPLVKRFQLPSGMKFELYTRGDLDLDPEQVQGYIDAIFTYTDIIDEAGISVTVPEFQKVISNLKAARELVNGKKLSNVTVKSILPQRGDSCLRKDFNGFTVPPHPKREGFEGTDCFNGNGASLFLLEQPSGKLQPNPEFVIIAASNTFNDEIDIFYSQHYILHWEDSLTSTYAHELLHVLSILGEGARTGNQIPSLEEEFAQGFQEFILTQGLNIKPVPESNP